MSTVSICRCAQLRCALSNFAGEHSSVEHCPTLLMDTAQTYSVCERSSDMHCQTLLVNTVWGMFNV